MPSVGFEPTFPAFELAKTVQALDRASSNAGIVGSNPNQDMDVCVRLFCVRVVL
jgi:hypothetical protein